MNSKVQLPGSILCPDAAPGAYTLAASGIVFKNPAGVEILRIWGTDPDDTNDWNSGNIYIGCKAGDSQPVDNVSAGFLNIGIGTRALQSVQIAASNVAVGADALRSLMSENYNVAIGSGAGGFIKTGRANTCLGSTTNLGVVTGSHNIAIGHDAGPATDLTGTITIGSHAEATKSNTMVVGEFTLTDCYFGSEAAASKIHAAQFIASAAPTITGSRAGNAALASLLENLAALGLIVDGTSA